METQVEEEDEDDEEKQQLNDRLTRQVSLCQAACRLATHHQLT